MKHKRRAVCIGFPYYAKFLSDMMNEHSVQWHFQPFKDGTRLGILRSLVALRSADALVCFGGPAPNGALIDLARRRQIPVFVVWAGSDVTKAQSMPQQLEAIKQEDFYNVSDGPWLVDELATLGIHAEYEPLTAVVPGPPVRPFPDTFRVLTYLPEPRRDFYGASAVYEVARNMPRVPFRVVGIGRPSPEAPDNVEFLGYVNDMPHRLDESTVLLRLPEHDGKSMLVLEALARGRHVIWNYEFPHVQTAGSVENVLEQLRDLHERHAAGKLPLNLPGREFVLANFARADIAARFERRLNRAVTEKSLRAIGPKRVAISGLDLFCADVCSHTKAILPDWEPILLRTSSRLEVMASIVSLADCDVWYSIGSPVADRWLSLAAKILRKPRVMHWVGSDIGVFAERPQLARTLAAPNVLHLAEVDWTAASLRRLGLSPRIAPLAPSHLSMKPHPLPSTFTVILYMPQTRGDFYGRSSYEHVMQRFAGKSIRYVIVGGGHIDIPPGVNAQNLGWRHDLRSVYENATVLIRCTHRDGLSLMVLEALSYGRHVLWTQDFPYCRVVRGASDIERELEELYELHERGALQPLREAADMIARRYNAHTCIEAIAGAWSSAMATQASSGALAVEQEARS